MPPPPQCISSEDDSTTIRLPSGHSRGPGTSKGASGKGTQNPGYTKGTHSELAFCKHTRCLCLLPARQHPEGAAASQVLRKPSFWTCNVKAPALLPHPGKKKWVHILLDETGGLWETPSTGEDRGTILKTRGLRKHMQTRC